MTNKPDPNSIKVQLNIPITWQFKQDLNQIAEDGRQSLASLVRESLENQLSPYLVPMREQRERIAVLEARQATQ